jgi:hypothetical protein
MQKFFVFSHPVRTYKACIRLTGNGIKNDGIVERVKKFRTAQKRKTQTLRFVYIFLNLYARVSTQERFLLYEIAFSPFHEPFSIHFVIRVPPYFHTYFL